MTQSWPLGPVGELQGRRGDGDAAGLLHLHPVRHGGAATGLAVDRAGLGDRPGVQRQRLGQGGFAGVGMADDREGSAAARFGGDPAGAAPRGPSRFPRRCRSLRQRVYWSIWSKSIIGQVARTLPDVTAIDPEQLAVCLEVLAEVDALPAEHPDAVAVRRATARMFKAVKQRRRQDRRAAMAAADRAVIAATATGAPGRIDDETQGIPLAVGDRRRRSPGTLLQRPGLLHLQAALHAGRRVLPPALPGLRRAEPRHARRPHRPDRPARAAHRRPRQDRHVHRAAAAARRRAHHDHHPLPATTRSAASRRMPDSADWLHRLRIVGIDLRDPAQVVALADSVAAAGPARHPDQQRRADRAPLARRVRALVGGRVARRCRTGRCRS